MHDNAPPSLSSIHPYIKFPPNSLPGCEEEPKSSRKRASFVVVMPCVNFPVESGPDRRPSPAGELKSYSNNAHPSWQTKISRMRRQPRFAHDNKTGQ
ncbi:hypothetical protein VTJ04DRAFT_10150 [Mycothermus thermophilus]|uniref:uncharacterized protein n=1 Tax=Humicola insolens TaxID=85995 RepID=UPI0037445A70